MFIKAKDLVKYILLISGKSPVKYRYSLLNPLINNSLELIESLYKANELDKKDNRRIELILDAKTKLKNMIYILYLS